ncbi:nucleotidyltransferase domain-containing protein [Desulfurobacterium thermolithotrophum]|uniref:nucleotidyltransferase domain-containing protein n=1 Tax=Desulfurobacterium thermolithotrophum TaxID=64160 RepID=UPI0013D6631B|nr:nucleotidyltransferase domain-containing protein [Desulfurobacterium thermolithotrophum]
MRLSKKELYFIKSLAIEVFGEEAEVWLFGSRVDSSLKGGDIDIYIEVPKLKDVVEKKLNYLVKLKDAIGDQKIDVVVKPKGCKELICREAKETGVKL